jgi:hypothetical protein
LLLALAKGAKAQQKSHIVSKIALFFKSFDLAKLLECFLVNQSLK